MNRASVTRFLIGKFVSPGMKSKEVSSLRLYENLDSWLFVQVVIDLPS
jgi:hypothetical protein